MSHNRLTRREVAIVTRSISRHATEMQLKFTSFGNITRRYITRLGVEEDEFDEVGHNV